MALVKTNSGVQVKRDPTPLEIGRFASRTWQHLPMEGDALLGATILPKHLKLAEQRVRAKLKPEIPWWQAIFRWLRRK